MLICVILIRNTIIGRRQANEVPSVVNKLAECDNTVHVATSPTESIQVLADKVLDSVITGETDERLQIPNPYAVLSTEDVRENINYQFTVTWQTSVEFYKGDNSVEFNFALKRNSSIIVLYYVYVDSTYFTYVDY